MLKYHNREYGFEGRPPKFFNFTEESDLADDAAEGEFPNRTTLGFGLDPKYPGRLFLQGKYGSTWSIGIQTRKKGKFSDAGDLYELSSERFLLGRGAKFFAGDLEEGVLKVAVIQDNAAVISFLPKRKGEVRLAVCPTGAATASVQCEKDLIKGRAFQCGVIAGEIRLNDALAVIKNRFAVTRDDGDKKDYLSVKSYFLPDTNEVLARSVALNFKYFPTVPLLFYAVIGEKAESLNVPNEEDAREMLTRAEAAAKSVAETGAGLAEGRQRALGEIRKHLVYDPYLMSTVLLEDKRAEDGFFSYNGLHRALGAMLAAVAEEYEAAETMALSAAANPVFGAAAALIVFRHTKNKKFAAAALPRLMEVFDANEKLVVADANTKRELSFLQDGSPLKEDLLRKGAAYSVDMSCYKLIFFRVIAMLLGELGVDASDYLEKAENLAKSINTVLFRNELGVYMNRHVSGEFAINYGFTSFLPLLAGAVTDGERLGELCLHLLNPKKFYDTALFPTLAKDHFRYGRRNLDENGDKTAKFENYCGMISPWVNALMYGCFRVAGIPALSVALAESSLRLFRREYLFRAECPSFYRPDGRRSTSEEKHSLCALAMPIFGALELLDYDYEEEDALRFGTTAGGAHSVIGVRIMGKTLDFRKDDAAASLYADGDEILRGESGNFEVRGLTESEGGLSFFFRAEASIKLTLKIPFLKDAQKRKIAFRIESGNHLVTVADGKVQVQTISI